MSADAITWTPHVRVNKFEPATVAELTDLLGHEPTGADLLHLQKHEGLVPDDVAEETGNLLTTAWLVQRRVRAADARRQPGRRRQLVRRKSCPRNPHF